MFNVKTVDEWIDKALKSPVKEFLPSAIQKKINISDSELVFKLKTLEDKGKIEIYYNIICPECFRTIRKIKDIPQDNVWKEDCITCGEVQVLSPDPTIKNMTCILKK